MFKKNITVVNSSKLGGKDSKKLMADVQHAFPMLAEDDVKRLLPGKGDVTVLKLSNRTVAYAGPNGNPLFFDPTGREERLLPTVYALWECPNMLLPLFTYSEVSPKVLGGADLFLQGLIVPASGLGEFAAGDLRTVAIPQNRYPFAVGQLEVSSRDIARTGLKGKGLKLLHHYGDLLWGLGGKNAPDATFTLTRVFPQAEDTGAAAAAKPGQASSLADEAAAAVEGLGISGGSAAPAAGGRPPAEDKRDREHSSEEQAASEASGGEDTAASLPQEPDGQVEWLLLAALHHVPDSALPMQTSDLLSKHMLALKPPELVVDFKKTSYKKLSKLLSTFEKKKLLGQKLIHKQDNIVSINRASELYTRFQGPVTQNGHGSSAAAARLAGPASISQPAAAAGKVDVCYQYRVPTSLRAVFGNPADKDALFSEQQVRAALQDYAQAQGLQAEGQAIRLDQVLAHGLYSKGEQQAAGDAVDGQALAQRLLSKLQLWHRVTRLTEQGSVEVVHRGVIKQICVQLEDRQGGRKHLTRLTHLESFGFDPDALAVQLQRAFNTASSVTRLPGKQETGKEVALQGDLLQQVPRFFQQAYGLDPKYVDLKSKSKG